MALRAAGVRNLVRYGVGDPFDFAAMMARKVARMWLGYFRGSDRPAYPPDLILHLTLLGAAVIGLGAGIARRRHPVLLAVLAIAVSSTALHALLVSQSRYNLPLVPVLVAAGSAGGALARRATCRPEGG